MDDHGRRQGERVTVVGAVVDAVLVAVKAAAGVFGGSSALLADAAHSLSDLVTDAVALVGLRLGRREPDATHHFGHRRLETLASAGVGVALVMAAAVFMRESALELWHQEAGHPTWPALAGAAVSMVVKEALFRYTIRAGRAIRSPVVVANAWHHRSDALSSVAVFVGVGLALLVPEWHFLDSVAALLVAVLVLKVGLEVVWDALREMTDAAPPVEVLERMASTVEAVDGVIQHHALKVRSAGGLHLVQVHVVVPADLTVFAGHDIAEAVELAVMAMDDVAEVIVHLDPYDPG